MFKDITGKKFNRLTAIRPNGKQGRNTKWLCLCDCGNYVTTNISSLTRGKCRSCGCLRRETTAENFRKHGKSKSKIYAVYCTMIQRCESKKNKSYSNYGGRGITVCEEWRNSFTVFYEWAMANGYSDGLTIDRIDTNGNYEPNNCRWVNAIEQANNKRNNELLEYNGEIHTIAEWARLKNMSYSTLYERIKVHNWEIERALNTTQRGR